MKINRIAIDIDNVLNTLCEAVLSVYNEDSEDNLTMPDITEYYIEKFVKPEYKKTFWHYFLDKRVWKRIDVVDGCVEYIEKLHNEGYEIIFVTKTESANLPKKHGWLQRNFPFLDIRKCLYSCPVKQYVKCDILIDDALSNLIGDREYYSICLAYPYNNVTKDIPNFVRVNNWKEIYDTIHALEGEQNAYSSK